jgi:putative Ca2+/H+ antiporter (TMEM165/GDT1 family)
MDAFLIALVMVFLAEMGDKTQLVALTLAGRYRLPTVLLGILLATGLTLALSVLLGRFLGGLVAGPWLQFLAGVSFILFGIWTLRGSDDDENGIREASNPFLVVFWTFLLGELGDKTMLTTTSLAAQYRFSAFPVWTGSTLGMVAADLLAIGVGWIVGTKLPERAIRRAVAVVFLALGAWDTWTSGRDFPLAAWGGASAFLLGATLILFRSRFRRRPIED